MPAVGLDLPQPGAILRAVLQSVSHPDSNDYAAFVQDTARLTPHLSLSLGARYDLQNIFKARNAGESALAASGEDAAEWDKLCAAGGTGYAFGTDRPVMVRRDLEFSIRGFREFISRR